jgi:hypothetical protein
VSSFTAWCHGAVSRLSAARAAGDNLKVDELVAALRSTHENLAERSIGTTEEQNGYLVARHTRTPVPQLAAVGIDTNNWPMPHQQAVAPSGDTEASPETSRRISDLFAAAGPLRDRSADKPRYVAEHRPQDGQIHRTVPLPWAIVDTSTGIAVAYQPDKDLAEYQAERAAGLFQEGREQA